LDIGLKVFGILNQYWTYGLYGLYGSGALVFDSQVILSHVLISMLCKIVVKFQLAPGLFNDAQHELKITISEIPY
jgi:hypothetical protein